jgi:hypothetical protein
MEAHRGGFPAMILFLHDRLFGEFDGAPDVDAEGYFVIEPHREEWSAWQGHYRGLYSPAVMASTERTGFLLTRTRWPLKDPAGAPEPAARDVGQLRSPTPESKRIDAA